MSQGYGEQAPPGQRPGPGPEEHPFFGKFDVRPGRWRPLYYPVEITVGVNAGDRGTGARTINNQPYVLTRLAGKIIGPTADPATSGLYQDGQWDMEIRDEVSNYSSGPIPGDLIMGSVATGYALPLEYPIMFPGNTTLTFDITNRVLRTLAGALENFQVGIVLCGVGDWGTLAQSARHR